MLAKTPTTRLWLSDGKFQGLAVGLRFVYLCTVLSFVLVLCIQVFLAAFASARSVSDASASAVMLPLLCGRRQGFLTKAVDIVGKFGLERAQQVRNVAQLARLPKPELTHYFSLIASVGRPFTKRAAAANCVVRHNITSCSFAISSMSLCRSFATAHKTGPASTTGWRYVIRPFAAVDMCIEEYGATATRPIVLLAVMRMLRFCVEPSNHRSGSVCCGV